MHNSHQITPGDRACREDGGHKYLGAGTGEWNSGMLVSYVLEYSRKYIKDAQISDTVRSQTRVSNG